MLPLHHRASVVWRRVAESNHCRLFTNTLVFKTSCAPPRRTLHLNLPETSLGDKGKTRKNLIFAYAARANTSSFADKFIYAFLRRSSCRAVNFAFLSESIPSHPHQKHTAESNCFSCVTLIVRALVATIGSVLLV